MSLRVSCEASESKFCDTVTSTSDNSSAVEDVGN